MTKLWIRLIKNHRIMAHRTVECARGDEQEALREACREMDVATPMWLSKNLSEFERFGLTAFVVDNFVEHIAFDRMEIEFIDDDDKKKRSADPRNVF